MREIRFHEQALAEYEELFQEFSGASAKLADRFEIQVLAFTRLIAANPNIFHACRYGVARPTSGTVFTVTISPTSRRNIL